MRHLPLFTALLLGLAGPRVDAAVITVTSNADVIVNDGSCTLREAINAANTNLGAAGGECPAGSGADEIRFAIPGSGPQVIMVGSQLPPITSPVRIDGYSQPGASPNTVNTLDGFDADLRIVLDGSQSGPLSKPGLLLIGPGAAGSEIRGLEIAGFSSQGCCADNGIEIVGPADGVVIAGNILHNNRSRGVFISRDDASASQGIRIGGPLPADRNLVHSHTAAAGIVLSACHGCVVENNWVGVRVEAGQPAAAGNLIGIHSSDNNALTVIRDNWVAASTAEGLSVASASTDITLSNNLIGGAFGNRDGVLIVNTNDNLPTFNRLHGNVITGNSRMGVGIFNDRPGNQLIGHVLQGNRVYANGALEINLGSEAQPPSDQGVNPNDPGDGDVGPNGMQNYPLLGAPVQVGPSLHIPYTLDSPAATYTLEFSFATQCDPSGHGLQGSMPRDPLAVEIAQPSGSVTLQPVGAPLSGFVVATATGSEGSSEFSGCSPYTFSLPETVFEDGFEG
jgi:CSLREA domain-containing protein